MYNSEDLYSRGDVCYIKPPNMKQSLYMILKRCYDGYIICLPIRYNTDNITQECIRTSIDGKTVLYISCEEPITVHSKYVTKYIYRLSDDAMRYISKLFIKNMGIINYNHKTLNNAIRRLIKAYISTSNILNNSVALEKIDKAIETLNVMVHGLGGPVRYVFNASDIKYIITKTKTRNPRRAEQIKYHKSIPSRGNRYTKEENIDYAKAYLRKDYDYILKTYGHDRKKAYKHFYFIACNYKYICEMANKHNIYFKPMERILKDGKDSD